MTIAQTIGTEKLSSILLIGNNSTIVAKEIANKAGKMLIYGDIRTTIRKDVRKNAKDPSSVLVPIFVFP